MKIKKELTKKERNTSSTNTKYQSRYYIGGTYHHYHCLINISDGEYQTSNEWRNN